MRLWQHWFGKPGQPEGFAPDHGRMQVIKHEVARLNVELRELLLQRQVVERRGCFSDRELEAKDAELERLDNRMKSIKNKQFRLRTFGRSD